MLIHTRGRLLYYCEGRLGVGNRSVEVEYMRLSTYARRIAFTVLAMMACLAMLDAPVQALMVVSRSQEVSIGKQVEADIIKQYGGLSTDRTLVARVARVGRQVAAASPRKDVTYTYKVVNSAEVNAMAAPGGPVVITKRLAQMLATDDELAFVLAHETGHIAAQHGRKAINEAMIAQGLASIFLKDSSKAAKVGVGVMYTLYTRGYSRKQEYQADSYGYELMTKAGRNADGAIKALAKLGMKRSSGVNKYLATHPDIPDRIDRIAQMAGIPQDRKDRLVKQAQSGKK